MPETLINVDNVSKKFCRRLKKSLWYGMQDLGNELIGRRHGGDGELRGDEFWAVQGISFELNRGECLGLIGRNGAGKTTLLRMLNGLIKPDRGQIEMRGRVGALIALGAGFNPILTGRENIYVNATVLGLSKREIDARLDEIIDFAELGDFIDAPVQSYSSGMQVRLGFAISTTLKPDILILDEVLAVGDAAFRHKCYHRLNKLMERSAVVLVSHTMDYIAQTSTKVVMMQRGAGELFTDPLAGIYAYEQENSQCIPEWRDGGRTQIVYPPVLTAEIRLRADQIQYGDSLEVEVDIDCASPIPDILMSFYAVNLSEQPAMCWHTTRRPDRIDLQSGRQRLTFRIAPLLLNNGDYYWSFSATRRGSIEHFIWFTRSGKFTVVSPFRQVGNVPYLPDTSELSLTPITD